MKQNPPQKHHYIPEFYLKRWTTLPDRRLWQYQKFQGRLVAERRFPSQTGYVKRLYSIEGAAESDAHRMEQYFFQPVDSAAADALHLMEIKGNNAVWNSRLRSAWSRFIHSLFLRVPEDLALFRKVWRHQILSDAKGEWEQRYQQVRKPHYPETLKSALESMTTTSTSEITMQALARIIDNASLGEKLNNLPWYVVNTNGARFDMMTSDRPIIRTAGLNARYGHIALPIGPRRLFVAGKDVETIRRFLEVDINDIVRRVNEHVVSCAVTYVYSVSSGSKRFVADRMSTVHEARLIESMARRRADIDGVAFPDWGQDSSTLQDEMSPA